MVLPKTPKQCVIKINSLKKQITVMEKRKSSLAKKKPVKKAAAKKKVAKRKPAKRKKRR